MFDHILESKNRINRNLNLVEPKKAENVPVISEEQFQKAFDSGEFIALEQKAFDQFLIDLQKAEYQYGLTPNEVLRQNIEKAKKDISKLRKIQKQDSRGRNMTYYVKQNVESPKQKQTSDGDKDVEIRKIPKQGDKQEMIHEYGKEIAHHSGISHEEYNKMHPETKRELLDAHLGTHGHNESEKDEDKQISLQDSIIDKIMKEVEDWEPKYKKGVTRKNLMKWLSGEEGYIASNKVKSSDEVSVNDFFEFYDN